MKLPRDVMCVRSAQRSVRMLIEWSPPAGILSTVACTAIPGHPDVRRVSIMLSATEGHLCMLAVTDVPDQGCLEALRDVANQLLRDAWDEPACVGIGPDADEKLAPSPSIHPILDISQYGRDMP